MLQQLLYFILSELTPILFSVVKYVHHALIMSKRKTHPLQHLGIDLYLSEDNLTWRFPPF